MQMRGSAGLGLQRLGTAPMRDTTLAVPLKQICMLKTGKRGLGNDTLSIRDP